MTTKKMYEKPSMRVFPLRQKPRLLVGSEVTATGVSATMNGTFTEVDVDE